jgi:hypothetical protein
MSEIAEAGREIESDGDAADVLPTCCGLLSGPDFFAATRRKSGGYMTRHYFK